jgi:hypothetical protein
VRASWKYDAKRFFFVVPVYMRGESMKHNLQGRVLFVCAMLFLSGSILGCVAVSAATMPPYPDAWEKELPIAVPAERLGVGLLDDGDVLISIVPAKRDDWRAWRYETFFGRKPIDAEKTAREKNAVIYADGTRSAIVRGKGATEDLADGRTVRISSNSYRGCYRGPARQVVSLVDASAKRVDRVFFYLLPRPKQVANDAAETSNDLGSRCPTEEQMSLHVSVESLSGSFLSLPDGGVIFIVPERSLLLRLDSNLQSKSKLMNTKVFSFPIEPGDYLFMPSINGKDYGSGEEKSIRFQELLDDLKAYLGQQRKEH